MLESISSATVPAVCDGRHLPRPKTPKKLDRGGPLLPKHMGADDKIGRFRAFPVLIFGNIGLMGLLGIYTKRHCQWDEVKGPIVPARAGCGKTMEKSTLTAKLWLPPGRTNHNR